MKFTKQEAVNLFKGLQNVGNLGGVKFSYAVSRNIEKLKPEMKAIEEAYKADKDFFKYDEERQALAKDHSLKVNGKSKMEIVDGNQMYIMKDQGKYDIALENLKKFHTEALAKREKQQEEFKKLMKEEMEIELYTMLLEVIPEGITSKQMTGILKIVDEKVLN